MADEFQKALYIQRTLAEFYVRSPRAILSITCSCCMELRLNLCEVLIATYLLSVRTFQSVFMLLKIFFLRMRSYLVV